MSLSKQFPLLFVTCTEDDAFLGKKGSVTIINYQNNELLKSIYTGYQPHGICVSDVYKKVYVAHRNIDLQGPLPHHISSCGGRNGYLTHIDLFNLEMYKQGKTELSVDPYSIDIIK